MLWRLGFIETHFPSGIMLVMLSSITLLAVAFRAWRARTLPTQLLAALALLIGGLIALNQHVVTGINMEFSSHYKMQITFANVFLVLAGVSAFGLWGKLSRRAVMLGAAALVILVSIPHVAAPYARAHAAMADTAPLGEQAEVLAWLGHAEPGVVYAPEALSQRIPAYTHHDVFYARNANFGYMPQKEVTDRFVIQNIEADVTDAVIREHERALFGVQYVDAYNHAALRAKALLLFGIHSPVPERIPQEATGAILSRAQEIKNSSLDSILDAYNVTYIVREKTAPPEVVSGFETILETLSLEVLARMH
jgi:hypothetical protein